MRKRRCQEKWKWMQLLQQRKRQSEWCSLFSAQSQLAWILNLHRLNISIKFSLKNSWLLVLDAVDRDDNDLQRNCTDFAPAFQDDVDSTRHVDEIKDCQILVRRLAGVDVIPVGVLKFIVYFAGNNVSRLESWPADSVDTWLFLLQTVNIHFLRWNSLLRISCHLWWRVDWQTYQFHHVWWVFDISLLKNSNANAVIVKLCNGYATYFCLWCLLLYFCRPMCSKLPHRLEDRILNCNCCSIIDTRRGYFEHFMVVNNNYTECVY